MPTDKVEGKKALKILAIDPATHSGWAHSDGPAGTWDLSVRRDESSGMRLVRLHGKLREILSSLGIDLVVFEAARHAAPRMQGALVTQAELQGVLKAWCEEQTPKIEYCGYSPSEIKKHASGKGNCSKDVVLALAKDKWPGRSMDDNEADARWLLDMAIKRYVDGG